MNIWIFNHYAITPDLPGGTRHYDLGKELVLRGHKVTIFASSFHHYIHKETRLNREAKWKVENVDDITFVWVKTPRYWRNDWRRVWNMVIFALRVLHIGRKLPRLLPEIGRPDAVIGSSPHLFTPLAAYCIARCYRVPFVMEVRDLWPQTIIDMGEMSEYHPVVAVLRILERFLYHRAERIITLLPFGHRYIMSCGIPQEKIVWIPNGVDLSRSEGLNPSAPDGVFRVLYLGAHGQANALDVLIHAAKILQDRQYEDIQIVLIGDGPEKPRLMSMVQDLGLRNVEFRDPVPKKEVTKVLGEADVTVFILHDLPLYNYGVSLNKLFDYLAASKPLLLVGNPSNNPVDEAQCGFTIPPRNPQALAEAIIKMYRMSEEERKAMGQRGRRYVEEHHDIKKLAMRLEEVLCSLKNPLGEQM